MAKSQATVYHEYCDEILSICGFFFSVYPYYKYNLFGRTVEMEYKFEKTEKICFIIYVDAGPII